MRFADAAVTTIVGPSGAGKTSLLRCLNRLEEPTGGSVLLDGRDIRSLEPTLLRRRVGMIFQVPIVLPGDVRANLGYGLDGIADTGLVDALRRADLDPAFLDRASDTLSVGQAQRVCIARALVREPEVLLMDEPTSALDKSATARIEELIVGLARSGLTVVVVTHDLAQAERVGDRAVLLVGGVVRMTGSPGEVADAWPGDPG